MSGPGYYNMPDEVWIEQNPEVFDAADVAWNEFFRLREEMAPENELKEAREKAEAAEAKCKKSLQKKRELGQLEDWAHGYNQ